MKAAIRFYKISLLFGAHAAAVVWAFSAVRVAMDGHVGAALSFAALSAITTLIFVIWWSSRPAN